MTKREHLAVVEGGITAADRGCAHFLGDEIVRQQHVSPVPTVEKDIQEVLSIGRADSLFVHHIGDGIVERFVLAGLQIVALRENETVVVRQENTGVRDRIEAAGLSHLLVVDEVAEVFFLIRADLEQNQIAHDCIERLCIIQCLIRIIHRFCIDAFTAVGVVFDLDRQIAAHCFHKDAIRYGDVRMKSSAMEVTGRALPLKFMLGWETELMVAAIVEITQSVVFD